ncbi:MAG: radical SAM protein [Candidatus Pacebacteria bacterium]|nr:radical SAM protein [Candidatus Paceibacterota bacterium]MBP9866527.1 radical SAM protein [Candidatus Paceibacterota bacterium]
MKSNYEKEVVISTDSCCDNSYTLDHFCGNGKRLSDTKSRCNVCGVECRAEIFRSNDTPPRIYMVKHCAEHGRTSSRISSDAQFYYSMKDGEVCACGTQGCSPVLLGDNAKTASQLHTCTLVVEIVYDCNLSCPTCYANSPKMYNAKSLSFLSFEDFKKSILDLYAKQGRLDIIQLSGGEPTLHPQLFEMIEWLSKQEWIADILLNTNGIKLADQLFMHKILEVVPLGRFGVYLQFDGNTPFGQVTLRGNDMRSVRERAIKNCSSYNIPVSLVMTVTHDNKFDCSTAITKALSDDYIRWIVFQPEFISGRNGKDKIFETPINVADVIHSVATGSIMDIHSWMPLPCSDPNCGTVGFLVRKDGVWIPVSKFVDMNQFSPFILNRMNFDIDDSLASCGCDNVSLEEELARYNIEKKDIKMVFIKPFMDIRTWDTKRIESCCTHVLTPEGKLDSFCRYYGTR